MDIPERWNAIQDEGNGSDEAGNSRSAEATIVPWARMAGGHRSRSEQDWRRAGWETRRRRERLDAEKGGWRCGWRSMADGDKLRCRERLVILGRYRGREGPYFPSVGSNKFRYGLLGQMKAGAEDGTVLPSSRFRHRPSLLPANNLKGR